MEFSIAGLRNAVGVDWSEQIKTTRRAKIKPTKLKLYFGCVGKRQQKEPQVEKSIGLFVVAPL